MNACLALAGRRSLWTVTQGGASLALGYHLSGFQPEETAFRGCNILKCSGEAA